jgi:hypothetical protein
MRVAILLLICWRIRYPFKNEPTTNTLTLTVVDGDGEPISGADVVLGGD